MLVTYLQMAQKEVICTVPETMLYIGDCFQGIFLSLSRYSYRLTYLYNYFPCKESGKCDPTPGEKHQT